jgi:peptidoglycan hydrolase CwlO-like protein
MQDLTDDERKAVLGEVLMDEFKAIREYLQDIPEIKTDIKDLKSDIAEIKSDIKLVKAIVREHESDIKLLKHKTA